MISEGNILRKVVISMEKEMIGCFAKSLAGHDRCTVYVIIDAKDEYVYLSDGKNKLTASPKKKKLKHIQPVKYKAAHIQSKLEEGLALTDEDIRKAIKQYNKEN